MAFRFLLGAALTLFCLPLLSEPAHAQTSRPTSRPAKSIRKLMAEALDDMTAGARKLKQAASAQTEIQSTELKSAGLQRYSKARDAYIQALKQAKALRSKGRLNKSQITQVNQICNYNLCCAHAQLGETKAALTAFAKALEAGFDDFALIERDSDLNPIRKEPRFVNLLERVHSRLAKEALAQSREVISDTALFPYDFKVTTLAGKTLSLKDLRGKVVIVDYWGTWCGPCKMEIPHFVKLKKELGDRLEIVGMTWEGGKAGPAVLKKVKKYAREVGINYPLTMLTQEAELNKIPTKKGEGFAFPTTLFIDKQGRVRAKEVGYRDYEVIKAVVTVLNAEKATTSTRPGKTKPKEEDPGLGPF